MSAPPRSAARVVAWMCLAHAASLTGFSTYPALLPGLQAEWGITNAEAGLVSGLLLAGYMIAVPLLTALTDRVDARRVYAAAAAAAAAGSIGFALFASGPLSASIAQALVGIGVAGTYMPGLKAMSDNLGASQSRAVSFYTATFGIGTSLSLLLAGGLADLIGWRGAFSAAALGPIVAAAMVYLGLPPRRPEPPAAGASLLDFRPVLAERRTRAFIFGYAVHCWELFGSRSWLVAFLSFAQGPSRWWVGPIAIVAMANLIAPASSILGNEFAMRLGRPRVIRVAMIASGCLSCALGFLSGMRWEVLAALVVLQLWLVNLDSSALTAGVVVSSDSSRRGATLAVHSTLGFGAGFIAPLAFGAMLDVAGGNSDATAWGYAFVTLGIGGVIAPMLLGFAGPQRR